MRREGIVKSVRGPGGGYHLAKKHQEITVKDIITAVDEEIDATQCSGKENCHEGGRCITHDLWVSINHKILDYLESLTLAHLVEAQSKDSKSRESAIYFLNDKLSQGNLAKAI
jgi:Rrf2 family iron-sulfur cluster assembly transcriptional regulator